jgi:genome maintenance exonuclease 1
LTYFKHTFFPNPPKLRTEQINGKRHYISPNGTKLPSVTTVLSLLSEAGIRAWKNRVGEVEADKVSTRALANGNELHLIVEAYLDNKPLDKYKNPVALKLFEQIKPELHNITNIRAQEVQLYSENLGVAGRVDCLGEYKGVLSVIDFKSAKKRKTKSLVKGYFLQATCYAMMIEELDKLENTKVDQIVILISAEDGTVVPFVEDKKQYIEKLMNVIEDYRLRQEFEIHK